jgi:hypothetical protein
MASLSYNIFKRDEAGAPIWVEAVQNLETAKSRIIKLSADAPGQYVVLSQSSGRVVSSGTIVASPAARAAHNVRKNSSRDDEEPRAIGSDTLWE